MGSVSIPLRSRKYPNLFAVIDEGDYERVSQYRWSPVKAGRSMYANARIDGKTALLHRFILNPEPTELVDHRDFNGLNCTRENMRLATKRQNQTHQRAHSDSTSGFKGVSLDKKTGLWRTYIGYEGVRWECGRHETAEHAALVHDCVARYLHGEFAFLNFPGITAYPFQATDFLRKYVPTSRYRGVFYSKQNKGWRAVIHWQGDRLFVGLFDTEEDAARARDRKVRELGWPLGLNFPDDPQLLLPLSQRTQAPAASGHQGIYKHRNGRWYPYVFHHGKRLTLGGFTNAEDAVAARGAKLAELSQGESP